MTLATYSVEVEDDHRHLRQVSHPRLVETPFRSPQLTLWTLGPDDWVLYWRTPDPAPARRKRRFSGIVQQLPLFDLQFSEKAVGANETSFALRLPHSHLHLVQRPSETEES